jgi:hypothetical protein
MSEDPDSVRGVTVIGDAMPVVLVPGAPAGAEWAAVAAWLYRTIDWRAGSERAPGVAPDDSTT